MRRIPGVWMVGAIVALSCGPSDDGVLEPVRMGDLGLPVWGMGFEPDGTVLACVETPSDTGEVWRWEGDGPWRRIYEVGGVFAYSATASDGSVWFSRGTGELHHWNSAAETWTDTGVVLRGRLTADGAGGVFGVDGEVGHYSFGDEAITTVYVPEGIGSPMVAAFDGEHLWVHHRSLGLLRLVDGEPETMLSPDADVISTMPDASIFAIGSDVYLIPSVTGPSSIFRVLGPGSTERHDGPANESSPPYMAGAIDDGSVILLSVGDDRLDRMVFRGSPGGGWRLLGRADQLSVEVYVGPDGKLYQGDYRGGPILRLE